MDDHAPVSPETSQSMRDVPAGGDVPLPEPTPLSASQRTRAAAQQAPPPAEPPSRMEAAGRMGAPPGPTQAQVQANEVPPPIPAAPVPPTPSVPVEPPPMANVPRFGGPVPAPQMPSPAEAFPPASPTLEQAAAVGQGIGAGPAMAIGAQPSRPPGGAPSFGADPRIEASVQQGIKMGYSEEEARRMAIQFFTLNGG
jgi:hypothetical protein